MILNNSYVYLINEYISVLLKSGPVKYNQILPERGDNRVL